ncbi:hypothetical protein [Spirosoma linguale]|uniref:Uncharacterized protein n=1 Tax=Spirosoma linguale (strain ATCC 33905 / DSM 74 / LMG 10896 / Claus 1) TaxID=504472 RepID=D2QNR8_SPILD|nr:hypothetical protein Slin_4626 [Spirosoma linguale DSM 74]
MKTLVTALLALSTSLVMAQHNNSISQSINDDGKTLSIRINGTVDDKPIDYDRTFDVSGLNKDERNALREHILDSLHVSMPEPPRIRTARAPRAPMAPRAPLAPISPRLHSLRQPGESVTVITSNGQTVSVSGNDNQVVVVDGKEPYTKEVSYNKESGKLHLRYRFKKDEDDFTYERTIDAPNKSQQERQRIIDDIEKTIGVPKASR